MDLVQRWVLCCTLDSLTLPCELASWREADLGEEARGLTVLVHEQRNFIDMGGQFGVLGRQFTRKQPISCVGQYK